MTHPLDIGAYAGPISVTVGYVAVYYATQIRIARLKFALDAEYRERGEKFDRYFGQDRRMLAADRVQLNMLEHMPPFLLLMWLHAVFIGTTGATIAGSVYLAARVAYPLLMGARLGRGIKAAILLATLPGYLVIAYLGGALLYGALTAA